MAKTNTVVELILREINIDASYRHDGQWEIILSNHWKYVSRYLLDTW